MAKKKKQKKETQKAKLKAEEPKVSKGKVVTTKKEPTLQATKSRVKSGGSTMQAEVPLLFGRKNFMFIFIGIACMALGMLFMSGGHMPSPDVWDEGIIYSFRRITLAPIMILLGLAIVLYSIFVGGE